MKFLSALVLCGCFVSAVAAQTNTPMPAFGKFTPMEVWDLGTFPGGSGSWTNDINDSGVAVGWASLSGWDQQHPAMISLLGPNALQWVDLGTLGGEGAAQANGISDTGIIVGHSFTSAGDDHAFVWTGKTGMVDLGTLPIPGHTLSMANQVNRNGKLIVGWSTASDGSSQFPVVWTRSRHGLATTWEMHQLDVTALGNYSGGAAYSVNRRGLIAGVAWGDAGFTGVLWRPVEDGKGWKPTQLSSAEYPIVSPNQQMNDLGELVGTACHADWIDCGVAVGQPVGGDVGTYKFTQLATPGGVTGAWVVGINNRGDISGVVFDQSGNYFGAQWSTKDPAFFQGMPALTGVWSFLAGINESGIAGGGYGVFGNDGSYFQHAIVVKLQ